MKYKTAIILMSATALCASTLIFFWFWNRTEPVRFTKQRLSDVSLLGNLYKELNISGTTNIQMGDLLKELQRRNVTLHSPIPINRDRSCYDIAVGTNSLVLIEENNNVQDNEWCARFYIGGHSVIEKRVTAQVQGMGDR